MYNLTLIGAQRDMRTPGEPWRIPMENPMDNPRRTAGEHQRVSPENPAGEQELACRNRRWYGYHQPYHDPSTVILKLSSLSTVSTAASHINSKTLINAYFCEEKFDRLAIVTSMN